MKIDHIGLYTLYINTLSIYAIEPIRDVTVITVYFTLYPDPDSGGLPPHVKDISHIAIIGATRTPHGYREYGSKLPNRKCEIMLIILITSLKNLLWLYE